MDSIRHRITRFSALLCGITAIAAYPAVNIKINFQPDGSPVPAGYVKDIGLPYDGSRGFGWVTEASLASPTHAGVDLRPNTRDRAQAGVAPELNTLIQAQDPIIGGNRVNIRSAWEFAVPVGTYEVTVSVGDKTSFDSHHYAKAEGASLVADFVPTAANPFKQATTFVTVTDGRLTLDAVNGANTKFNYVHIASADGSSDPGEIGIENLDGVPYPDRLVFSRINGSINAHKFHDVAVLRVRNTGAGPLTLSALNFTVAGKWNFPNNDAAQLPITIAAGGFRDIPVKFIENMGSRGVRQGELVIVSDDADEHEVRVQLAGAYMTAPEGGNEVFNPDILAAFGLSVRQLHPGESLGSAYLAIGEEVITDFWRRARPAYPVNVRQLAAFHGCCSDPVLFEMLGTGGGGFRHDPAYGQSLLPLKQNSTSPAAGAFNPTADFRFRIAGYNSAYNSTGHAGVRAWPARDRNGALIPDTYYVIQDYVNGGAAANLDFNDNIYLISNIKPVSDALNPNIGGLYPGMPGLVLGFNQDIAGSLADKDGIRTGFAKSESNTADRTNAVNSYQPAGLDMDLGAGTLKLTTSPGSNTGADNTLVNGLLLPFDGRQTRFSVRGTLLAPAAVLNANGHQAGISLGSDRDNAVRLAAGVFASGGAFSLRFQKEAARTATTVSNTAIATAGLQALELVLLGNPATGTVTAAYRATYNGSSGALTALPGSVVLTGTAYYRIFDRRSFAGILASHGAATPVQATFDSFAVQSEAAAGSAVVRLVDVGGSAPYTAADGRVWGTDAGLFNPSNAPAESWGSPAIANTADDVLYRTYRSLIPGNPAQDNRVFTYAIPVAAPGPLIVKLHFAEIYWGAANGSPGNPGPGKRVFDVIAEGKTVLQDFDISAAAGGALNALVVPLEGVNVNDGALTLTLKAKVDFGSMSAIEVLKP